MSPEPSALLLNSCDLFHSKLVTACETVLKQRLLSSAEYKRIKVSELDELQLDRKLLESYLVTRQQRSKASGYPLAIDDAWIQTELKAFDNGISRPSFFSASIVYETLNDLQEPVRHLAKCVYVGNKSDSSLKWEVDTTLDGLTGIEWRFSN
ncbi:hypothetical protein G6M04_04275 [Agrobacterium rhizogenes]|uniref:hypothetical protein n=1 Tax=Rhizobium rhizogenes TaxID=359 RepID=UPI001571B623|nr:hypothetical protein [Rhizobium rhizogenes]NTG46579.1 hypothetical protein [Rhizobium rhizogenes]